MSCGRGAGGAARAIRTGLIKSGPLGGTDSASWTLGAVGVRATSAVVVGLTLNTGPQSFDKADRLTWGTVAFDRRTRPYQEAQQGPGPPPIMIPGGVTMPRGVTRMISRTRSTPVAAAAYHEPGSDAMAVVHFEWGDRLERAQIRTYWDWEDSDWGTSQPSEELHATGLSSPRLDGPNTGPCRLAT